MASRRLLLLAVLSLLSQPARSAPAPDTFLRERDDLLMLAAMSYTYAHRLESKDTGGVIAALLAWDVERPEATPRFVIDRNRNKQLRGEIFHAEKNVIEKAFRYINDLLDVGRAPNRAFGKKAMEPATLYTTLEPCVMCGGIVLGAGIPRVFRCMDDPRHYDLARARTTQVPHEAYGRKVEESFAALDLCGRANEAMWAARLRQPETRTPTRTTAVA